MQSLRQLTGQFARAGRVEAIYLRAARDVRATSVNEALAMAGRGLKGDRSADRQPSASGPHKRQVTLFQAEHLALISAWIDSPGVDAALLRRNLVISGINLLAARSLFADRPTRIQVGSEVLLMATGTCEPCSRMEAGLGRGSYNAMRGHGGLTAAVEVGGHIAVGDWVRVALVGELPGARIG